MALLLRQQHTLQPIGQLGHHALQPARFAVQLQAQFAQLFFCRQRARFHNLVIRAREHAVIAVRVVAVIHQFLVEHAFTGVVFGRLAHRFVFAAVQGLQRLLRGHDGVVVLEDALAFLDAQSLGHRGFTTGTGHSLHLGFARLALFFHVVANLVAQIERLDEVMRGEGIPFLVRPGVTQLAERGECARPDELAGLRHERGGRGRRRAARHFLASQQRHGLRHAGGPQELALQHAVPFQRVQPCGFEVFLYAGEYL